jgi:hypothetical protein
MHARMLMVQPQLTVAGGWKRERAARVTKQVPCRMSHMCVPPAASAVHDPALAAACASAGFAARAQLLRCSLLFLPAAAWLQCTQCCILIIEGQLSCWRVCVCVACMLRVCTYPTQAQDRVCCGSGVALAVALMNTALTTTQEEVAHAVTRADGVRQQSSQSRWLYTTAAPAWHKF